MRILMALLLSFFKKLNKADKKEKDRVFWRALLCVLNNQCNVVAKCRSKVKRLLWKPYFAQIKKMVVMATCNPAQIQFP